jgi:PAS domain S-box-containing protein
MDASTPLGAVPALGEELGGAFGEEPGSAGPVDVGVPDFAAVFAAMPGVNLLLAADPPRFTMLAASDERLAATLTTREGTLGRPLFEVFSDANPENGEASGAANLRASLETVLRTRAPHRMGVQRYDIQRPDGGWEVRHWAPRNVPVLGPDGAVRYVVHHVEDVTEAVRLGAAHDRLRSEYAESEDARSALLEANARLQDQQLELELANQQLQEQAAELEQQAEALQVTAGQLEERTRETENERARVVGSEARYRALFESIDEGFAVIEVLVDEAGAATDYRFVEANPAFVQQSGLANAVGRTVRELVPGIEQEWIERYAHVAASGEATRFQSGSEVMGRWFDVFAFRVGRPAERRVALLFTDVSVARTAELERERLLAALELERARLAYVFQQAPAFLAVLRGPDYVFTLVNDALYQLVGDREIVGRPIWEALPDVRGQGFEERLDRVVATGEPFVGREVPLTVARTPGVLEERFVDLTYMPLVEPDGTRVGVIAHGTDVTEQVRARREVERLLAESERARADAERARRETAGILAATSDGILGVDPDGRTTFVNAAAERLLGWSAGEFVGRRQHALIHHTRPDGTPYPPEECPLHQAVRRGEARHVEGELFWRKDGTSFPVEYAMTPLVDGDGARGAVVTFRDVTERRRTEAERERLLTESEAARREAEAARKTAEAANRAKAEFLATMSHELRTPLNAIGGYAELMEMGIRGPVTDEQRQDLGRIQQSQRHLLGLVDEVLDLAKVDAGALRVESAAVRAGDTVDAALALVRPQAAAKGLTLSETCGGAADRPYLGDEPRVRQVLVNLLANAIKFTATGGQVAIGCALTDAPPAGRTLVAGTPYVALRVEDTGMGIPEEQRETIFEPFTQLEHGTSPYTRPTGGTGLGLAISRRLARLMGGDLTVESRMGRGSVFTLWLPTPERRGAARPTPVDGSRAVAGGAVRRPSPATPPEVALAVSRIGSALAAEAGPVIRAWVARLRADPAIPAAGRRDAEVEDHVATFVTDAGLALRALGEPGGEQGGLLRDSRAIQAVVAERHGAQRARLGWSEAAVVREFALLREVLDEAVQRLAGEADPAAAERVHGVIAQILAQVERVSLGSLRLARGAERPS